MLGGSTGSIAQACHETHACRGRLRPGWLHQIGLPGAYANDLADHQWRDFRGALPLLIIGALVHGSVSILVRSCSPLQKYRPTVSLLVSLGFLIYVHGAFALFSVGLGLLAYLWAKATAGTPLGLPAAWGFGLFILVIKERLHKWCSFFGLFFPPLYWLCTGTFLGELFGLHRLLSSAATLFHSLDGMKGEYGWHSALNLVALRLISFHMDLHWSRLETTPSKTGTSDGKGPKEVMVAGLTEGAETALSPMQTAAEKEKLKLQAETQAKGDACAVAATAAAVSGAPDGKEGQRSGKRASPDGMTAEYQGRMETSLETKHYNLTNVLAHAFYVPLYLAGPTITFNAFTSQLLAPQRTHSPRFVVLYGLRWLYLLLLMELVTHYTTCFAVGMSGIYEGMSPRELANLAYLTLMAMWLKFAILWRFARLWSLLDGVDVVENMVRCMNNNYSLNGFWKGWHVSFNRWLIRYIYLPLGGAPYKHFNVWAVFGFVAVWHDVEVKLLAWGGLNAAFMTLEVFAVGLFRSFSLRYRRPGGPGWIRNLSAAAGASYVVVLMFVNLVGYGVGLSGSTHVLRSLLEPEHLLVFAAAFAILFSAVQIMFEIRAFAQKEKNAETGPPATAKKEKNAGRQTQDGKNSDKRSRFEGQKHK